MEFAVIFDMDGVIVDNGNFHQKAWKIFCEKHDIYLSADEFKSNYFGRTNEKVLPELFGKELLKNEIITLADEKEKIYREIYQTYLKPLDGLLSFLEELLKNKIPIGIATSAPKENVNFILDGLDIRKYVEIIVDDSMVHQGKPHPEIYLKAAKLLKTEPENCVVFEDSIAGTKSARDAGCKVIALTTTLPATKHKYAHKIISDFNEISIQSIETLISQY